MKLQKIAVRDVKPGMCSISYDNGYVTSCLVVSVVKQETKHHEISFIAIEIIRGRPNFEYVIRNFPNDMFFFDEDDSEDEHIL